VLISAAPALQGSVSIASASSSGPAGGAQGLFRRHVELCDDVLLDDLRERRHAIGDFPQRIEAVGFRLNSDESSPDMIITSSPSLRAAILVARAM